MRATNGQVARHRGGLAGFDQPRFLHADPTGPLESPAPAAADLLSGQALIGRAALAVVLLAIGPALDRDAQVVGAFGWLVALVWLPGVGVLDLARRRWAVRHLGAVELVWDVALLAGVDGALHAPATAGLGYLLVLAYHAYVGGPRRAMAAVVLCSAATIAAPAVTDQAVEGSRLAVQLLAMALLAWLLADASQRHDTSRAGMVMVSEKAAAIVAGIAEAVAVMSARGRILEWNPAASRLVGCPETVGRGQRCSDVLALHTGLRALQCDDGCALLEQGPAGQSVELWRRDATGRRQPLLASASAVSDEAGTPIEVIHSFRDITALKAADEAKTLFLATASHELKTPLTVIHGFAQMLRHDQVPADQRRRALDAIEARSQQLVGIVDRLLMSSRIEAGRIDLVLGMVDLAPLLRDRARALEASTSRRIAVAVDEVPLVHAEADALTTILDHLVDNAAKYSPSGTVIRVACTQPDPEGPVHLSVSDDGIGMTTEQMEHCFDRFWQAETTDVRRFGGTGIGLYIVRSLVEALGGSIHVESAPGEGTRFELRLRTAPVPVPAPDAEAEPAGTADGQSSMIREYMRQVGVPLQGSGGRP